MLTAASLLRRDAAIGLAAASQAICPARPKLFAAALCRTLPDNGPDRHDPGGDPSGRPGTLRRGVARAERPPGSPTDRRRRDAGCFGDERPGGPRPAGSAPRSHPRRGAAVRAGRGGRCRHRCARKGAGRLRGAARRRRALARGGRSSPGFDLARGALAGADPAGIPLRAHPRGAPRAARRCGGRRGGRTRGRARGADRAGLGSELQDHDRRGFSRAPAPMSRASESCSRSTRQDSD